MLRAIISSRNFGVVLDIDFVEHHILLSQQSLGSLAVRTPIRDVHRHGGLGHFELPLPPGEVFAKGRLSFTQAFKPPCRLNTLVNPSFISVRAPLAPLVPLSQYVITFLSRHFFKRLGLRLEFRRGHVARVADMAGVVGFLAAQIDDQSALIHEPHGLHGAQCGKGLHALADFIESHGGGGQHRSGRQVRMMANELEQSLHAARTIGFSGRQV